MNPILVLQKRLDIAVTEIQELRVHADELQEQLNVRTASLEQKLKTYAEKQEESEKAMRWYVDNLRLSDGQEEGQDKESDSVGEQEQGYEQEMKTPTSLESFSQKAFIFPSIEEVLPCKQPPMTMPGRYEQGEDEEEVVFWSWPQTQNFLIWCLAKILQDDNSILQLTILLCVALTTCYCGAPGTSSELLANLVCTIPADEHAMTILSSWIATLIFMVRAAVELRSQWEDEKSGGVNAGCGSKGIYDVDADEEQTARIVETLRKHTVSLDVGR